MQYLGLWNMKDLGIFNFEFYKNNLNVADTFMKKY